MRMHVGEHGDVGHGEVGRNGEGEGGTRMTWTGPRKARNARLVALALGASALLLGLATPAAAHPHGDPFLIGLAPQQDAAKVYQMMQPFLEYLEREVKYKFTFETAPTIQEFQRRVLDGRYDIWWGNPLTYIQASKKGGYYPVAGDTTRDPGLL